MVTRNRVTLALLLANLGIWSSMPAQASAHETDATTVAIVDAAIDRVKGDAINHCRGDRRFTYDANLGADSDGVADGWVLSPANTWAWSHTVCGAGIRMRPGLGKVRECHVLYHEKLHFVLGPEHVGPLHYNAPFPAECDAMEPAAPAPAEPALAPEPRCHEDSRCWVWSSMGNRRRTVRAWSGKRIKVGPCAFRRLDRQHKIRYSKLKGDQLARDNGCTDHF